jgi:hypothetical protein
VRAQAEKIVIVSADFAGLNTYSGILKRLHLRQDLGKQPRLHLFCDLQFVSRAPLGFQLGRNGTPLRFNGTADFIETHQRKGVVVEVLKARKYSAPDRRLVPEKQRLLCDPGRRLLQVLNAPQPRRVMKADSALSPFAVFGGNVFRNKNNLRRPSDEFVLFGLRFRHDQVEHCRSVWWRDAYPPPAGLKDHIRNQPEPKLIYIELQAFLQIADKNVNRLNPEIKVPLLLVLRGLDTGRRRWVHRRDYKAAEEL